MKVKMLSGTNPKFHLRHAGDIGTLIFTHGSAIFRKEGTEMGDEKSGFTTSYIIDQKEHGRQIIIETRNSTYIFEKEL